MDAISVKDIHLAFGEKEVLSGIDWTVKRGEIATLIGPNGCGKSTLLRVITRNTRNFKGEIWLEEQPIASFGAKEMAQHIAFLPQTPELPRDMVVEELVYCGRFPYQNWWKNTVGEDRIAVDQALEATKTSHLRHRIVASLSGGERQRVWIAMALAQEPDILVLDEPTTYLDINHQLEVLELLKKLNHEKGITVLMVLHELNQAAAYSHQIAVLCNGQIAKAGTPNEVMHEEMMRTVFKVDTTVELSEDGVPYIKVKGLL